MFSRQVLDSKEKVLIQKVPTSWSSKTLDDSLMGLMETAHKCKEAGITSILYNNVDIPINRFDTLTIVHKFLGIPYCYVDIIIE